MHISLKYELRFYTLIVVTLLSVFGCKMTKTSSALKLTSDPSVLAYYMFNKNANDLSHYGNHGIVHGATLAKDRHNIDSTSYYFDGLDDFIDLGSDSNFILGRNESYSISAWVKPELSESIYSRTIISKYIAASNFRYFQFSVRDIPDSILFYKEFENGGTTFDIVTSKYSLNWMHVALVANDLKLILYVNGKKISEADRKVTMKKESGSALTYIGAIHHARIIPDNFFKGFIDEVIIFNRALSSKEVKSLSK